MNQRELARATGRTCRGALIQRHSDGAYTAFSLGATVAGGGVAYLRNQNGVVIRIDSTTAGLRFNLAPSGVTLKLKSRRVPADQNRSRRIVGLDFGLAIYGALFEWMDDPSSSFKRKMASIGATTP